LRRREFLVGVAAAGIGIAALSTGFYPHPSPDHNFTSEGLWRPRRNDQVIFFGWDGCERDLTVEMMVNKELPTLSRMASTTNTSWMNATVTDHTTDTRSGWTQVLTGLCAEVTKVFNNSDWEPIGRPGTIFDVLKTRDAQTATALFSGKAIYSIS